MEGGKHGDWATDIQEFMILPKINVFPSFSDILQAGVKIFHQLGKVLESKNYATGVGFEGAFCPKEISSNEEALDLITRSIHEAGYSTPDQFSLAVDIAASEFYQDGRYVLKSEAGQSYDAGSWIEKIKYWTQNYPLISIEDPIDQARWEDWSKICSALGPTHQIVGDDLVVTNISLIQKAVDNKACNAVIIKPNQIGTVTETLKAVDLARQSGYVTIVSHRGGETIDSFIADLAVGTASPECKFGGPNRGERLAKYNRLLAIEAELNS
jgi:enolase